MLHRTGVTWVRAQGHTQTIAPTALTTGLSRFLTLRRSGRMTFSSVRKPEGFNLWADAFGAAQPYRRWGGCDVLLGRCGAGVAGDRAFGDIVAGGLQAHIAG